MNKRVTIREIAKECGLSAMTVSRVFRQSENVNEETRDLVLRTAETLGYCRNTRQGRPSAPADPAPVAQILAGSFGTTPPIFHLRLLVAVEQELSGKGYDCIIRFCDGGYAAFTRTLEAVRRTDAAVTIGLGNFPDDQLRALQCARPGILLLDNPGVDVHDALFNSIVFDNVAAAGLAVHHLAERGRKRILLLTGPQNYLFAREMEIGVRAELARLGWSVDPDLIVRCDFSPRDAAEALDNILRRGIRFDAVFTNDEMASAVYRILPRYHLSIPRDVAVCGCDNIPSSEQLHPELTTISLSSSVLAKEAAEIISRPLPSRPYRLRLQPELIIREST